MADVLNLLGESVMPKIFAAQLAAGLADAVEVIRVTSAPNGYGGHTETEAVALTDIPCKYTAKAGSSFTPGTQWTRHLITMPAVFEGEAVDVKNGDKLRMLERGLQPERVFHIREIRNKNGITLEIECSLSE